MKTLVPFALVSIMFGVPCPAAEPALPEFNSNLLGQLPRSLHDITRGLTFAEPSAQPRTFSSPALTEDGPTSPRAKAEPRIDRTHRMPIVRPNPDVDYKMLVKAPDASVDFKMRVLTPESPAAERAESPSEPAK